MNLKLAIRRLFKTPFVTIVAILSLALGIGANAAIFSLFDQTLLRALPVQRPNELVNFSSPGPKQGSNSCGQAGDCESVFSYPMFRDLEKQQTVFTGIAAHVGFGANLSYQAQTRSGDGMLVSGSYFPVLGLQPALGRLLDPNDDRNIGGHFVTVLSHAYWTTRLGASPDVLNQTLIVNGQPMTIVGVAPRGFNSTTLGMEPEVFVPITMRELMVPGWKGFDNRRSYWAYLFARLKPGVSIDQARAAMNGVYRPIINDVEAPLQKGMSDQTMARFKARTLVVEPGRRGQSSGPRRGEDAADPAVLDHRDRAAHRVREHRQPAARARRRTRDRDGGAALARRHAAGSCSRSSSPNRACWRCSAGSPAWSWRAGRWRSSPRCCRPTAPRRCSSSFSCRSCCSRRRCRSPPACCSGCFPRCTHASPTSCPRSRRRRASRPGARAAARFRSTLVTAQIALSMALLISAGLFVKSLMNVSRVDLGVKIDNVVTFGLSPDLNGYDSARARTFFERTEEELAAVPGVTAVAASMVPLLAGSNWGSSVSVQGFEKGPDTDAHAYFNEISPGYFRTLGIPLMSGREFTAADAAGAPKVVIVNEAFAKKFNLGREAVGKRMSDGGPELDMEIVGVVQNAKYSEVRQEPPPVFFMPYRQNDRVGSLNFYVRTSLDPEQLLRHRARRRRAARSEPAAREPEDDAAAGARERVHGPDDQHAVGGLRAPGDAARGGRAVRRARLHRVAAHARDRPAHGARRGRRPHADG